MQTFCNSGCACLQLWGRALWALTKACLDRWLGEGVSPSVRSRTATMQLLQTADEPPESVGRQAAAAVAAATTATAHVLSCIVASQPAAAATGGRPAAEMLVGGMARGRKPGTGKGSGKPKAAAGAAASVADGRHPRQPHSERSGCGNGGGDDAGGVNSGGGGGSERAPPLVDLTTMVGLNLAMKPMRALVAYSRQQDLERMNATALAARLGQDEELMSAAREGAAAAAGAFADWALPRLAGHAPQLPPSSVSALTELVAEMVRILLCAGNAQRLMAFARAPTHRGGLETYQRAAAAIEKLLAAGAACTEAAVAADLHWELLVSLQTAASGLPPGSVPAFGALCRALEAMLAASAEAQGDYAARGAWAETRREILKLAPRRLAPQLEACLAPVGRAAEPPADPAARSAGAAQRPAAGDLAAAAAAAQAAADELLVSASVSGSFCTGFPDRILQVRSISPPRCPHPLAQRAAAGAVCCLEPSSACPHLRGSHVLTCTGDFCSVRRAGSLPHRSAPRQGALPKLSSSYEHCVCGCSVGRKLLLPAGRQQGSAAKQHGSAPGRRHRRAVLHSRQLRLRYRQRLAQRLQPTRQPQRRRRLACPLVQLLSAARAPPPAQQRQTPAAHCLPPCRR